MFARGVFGLDGNTSVGDLKGAGTSGTVNFKGFSASRTYPEGDFGYGVEAPINELGIASPGVDGTFSYGYGLTLTEYYQMLSDFFEDSFYLNFPCP